MGHLNIYFVGKKAGKPQVKQNDRLKKKENIAKEGGTNNLEFAIIKTTNLQHKLTIPDKRGNSEYFFVESTD